MRPGGRNANSSHHDAGEQPRSWLTLAVWALLFQFAWHFGKIGPLVRERAHADSDDFLRLHQVRNYLDGQGWFDVSVPRMNAPFGADMHWSRLVDLPQAAMHRLFGLFMEIGTAEQVTAVVWPTLLFLVTVLILVRVTETAFPGANRLLALLFAVTCNTALVEFAPGRIDHHNVQILLFSLTLLGLVSSARWWGHFLIGMSIACSIAIGLDVILLLVFVLAWLGIEWAIGMDGEGRGLSRVAAALALTAFALFPLTVAPGAWFEPVCDATSTVYLAAQFSIAAAFLLLALVSPFLAAKNVMVRAALRLAAGAVLAAIAAYVLYRAFPGCIAGPLSDIGPELREEWLSKVMEAKGLIELARTEGWHWLGTFAYVIVIAAGGIWMAMSGRSPTPRFLALLAIVVITALLGFIQVRAFRIGMFATVPVAVVLASAILERLSARYAGQLVPRAVFKTAAIAALMSPTWLVLGQLLLPAVQTGSSIADEDISNLPQWRIDPPQPACNMTSQFARLGALEKGVVLNDINSGPAILVNTHHDVVGGNYHRNESAILDSIRFFSRLPDEAHEIVMKRSADYVALCEPDPRTASGPPPQGSMLEAILEGNEPDWMVRISHKDERLILFRIAKGG